MWDQTIAPPPQRLVGDKVDSELFNFEPSQIFTGMRWKPATSMVGESVELYDLLPFDFSSGSQRLCTRTFPVPTTHKQTRGRDLPRKWTVFPWTPVYLPHITGPGLYMHIAIQHPSEQPARDRSGRQPAPAAQTCSIPSLCWRRPYRRHRVREGPRGPAGDRSATGAGPNLASV